MRVFSSFLCGPARRCEGGDLVNNGGGVQPCLPGKRHFSVVGNGEKPEGVDMRRHAARERLEAGLKLAAVVADREFSLATGAVEHRGVPHSRDPGWQERSKLGELGSKAPVLRLVCVLCIVPVDCTSIVYRSHPGAFGSQRQEPAASARGM